MYAKDRKQLPVRASRQKTAVQKGALRDVVQTEKRGLRRMMTCQRIMTATYGIEHCEFVDKYLLSWVRLA